MMTYAIFQVSHPTRAQVVAAARLYLGVSYTRHASRVVWNDDLQRYQGKSDCLRFLLHVARDCGYLARDFDVNLSRPHPKLQKDAVMWQLLENNLDRIPTEDTQPGDVLLLIYNDINRENTEVHHVAIVSNNQPLRMIHCEDYALDGTGCVRENDIDIKFQQRIHSVWRLRGILEKEVEVTS